MDNHTGANSGNKQRNSDGKRPQRDNAEKNSTDRASRSPSQNATDASNTKGVDVMPDDRKHNVAYLALMNLFREYGFDVSKFEAAVSESTVKAEPIAETKPVDATPVTVVKNEDVTPTAAVAAATPAPAFSWANRASAATAQPTVEETAKTPAVETPAETPVNKKTKEFVAPTRLTLSIFDKLMADAHRFGLSNPNVPRSKKESAEDIARRSEMSRIRAQNIIAYEDGPGAGLDLFPPGAFKVNTIQAPYNVRGVVNRRGVDCYVNAVLQALLVCPPLMKLLSHNGPGSALRPVASSVARFAAEFYATTREPPVGVPAVTSVLNPAQCLKPMDDLWSKHIADAGQQDAGEFVMWLLNQLHEETMWRLENVNEDGTIDVKSDFTAVGKKPVSKVEVAVREDSPIHRIFALTTRNVYTNAQGQSQTPREELFSMVPLPLKAEPDADADRLEAAMATLYANDEIMDNGGRMTSKIARLPLVLCCSFKRTVYVDNQEKKVERFIEYPQTLTVQREWLDDCLADEDNLDYELVAVIGHQGKEANEGHYKTFVRRSVDTTFGTQEWTSVDDALVRDLKDSDEWKRCEGAYLLFYIRKDASRDIRPRPL